MASKKANRIGHLLSQIFLLGLVFNVNVKDVEAKSASVITLQKQHSVSVPLRYTGTVESKNTVELSFESGGKLSKLHADFFDYVERGQVMASLDTSILDANRKSLLASLARQKIEVDFRERALNRAVSLHKEGRISSQSFEDQQYAFRSASEVLLQLKAELELVDIKISKAVLTAPFSGVITSRFVEPSQVVGAGQSVYQLVSNDDIRARIGVPVEHFNYFTASQDVSLYLDNQRVVGKFSGRSVEQNTRSKTVSLMFSLPEQSALPGQLVSVELPQVINEPGYWVPLTAIVSESKGRWSIFTLENDLVAKRAINVLVVENDAAYITSDLEGEIQVISDGLNLVVPGQAVTASIK